MKKWKFRLSVNLKLSILITLTIFIIAVISAVVIRMLFMSLIVLNDSMTIFNTVDSVMEYAGEIDEDEEVDKCINSISAGDDSIEEVGLVTYDREESELTVIRSTDKDRNGITENAEFTDQSDIFSDVSYMMSDYGLSDLYYTALYPIDNYAEENSQYYIYVKKDSHKSEDEAAAFLIIYTFIFVVLMIIVGIFVFQLMKITVTRPIKKLSKAANEFALNSDKIKDTKFFSGLKIRSHDEIMELAATMQKMEDSLHEYIEDFEKVTEEKQRISTEIEVAANIQANMLPKFVSDESLPYDITFFIKPARIVGGDFYDYFRIDDDRIALVIADVSDKGVPASLFMVQSRSVINNCIMTCPDDLSKAMENANKHLCYNNEDMMFVTVFACIYVISSGKLFYVNAGHENPIVYKADAGEYLLIKEDHDVFLGIMDDQSFVCREMDLSKGDKLYLYTDGVTDVADAHENLYGEERIASTFNKNKTLSGKEIFDALLEDIDAYRGDVPQPDDITMLLFEV